MKTRHYLFVSLLLAASFFAGAAWNFNDGTSYEANDTPSVPATQAREQGVRQVSDIRTFSDYEQATIDLFEDAAPSVVFITSIAVQRDYWTRNVFEIPRGTGSGFIWDDQGHVVTNYHVIRGGKRAQVTLADQSTWDAVVVGYAEEKDLAVLKIDAPKDRIKPIKVGTSTDLRVGQFVYAIGNPFGLDQTLTTGVISAVGREITSLARVPIRDVIQTDAAINPGNSGGPLLDSSGRLIGVNTQIYSPSGASAGIGFSIPVDAVRWVVPDLITYGELKRPVLGVELVSTNSVRQLGLEGALVLNVIDGSGAENAGLKSTRRAADGEIILGDLIIAVNDEEVKSNNDLVLALENYEEGQEVMLTVMRGDDKVKVPIVLGSN